MPIQHDKIKSVQTTEMLLTKNKPPLHVAFYWYILSIPYLNQSTLGGMLCKYHLNRTSSMK